MGGWPSGSAVEEVSAGSDGVCMCVLGGGGGEVGVCGGGEGVGTKLWLGLRMGVCRCGGECKRAYTCVFVFGGGGGKVG